MEIGEIVRPGPAAVWFIAGLLVAGWSPDRFRQHEPPLPGSMTRSGAAARQPAATHASWTVHSDAEASEVRALSRQAVNDVGNTLALIRPFPRHVTVRLERCGAAAEAVWLPDAGDILLCDEALSHALRFTASPLPVLRYIVGHELGHAVADLFAVPVSGSGEADADEFAAVLLIERGATADQPPRR